MLDEAAGTYAMQNTQVLYLPDRRIDSFGDTSFNFYLLSEPMDEVGHCRIRTGRVEAGRPRILRPDGLQRIETEGFGPDAARFFEMMAGLGVQVQALLRYGFRFSRSEVSEEYLHEDIREVSDRVVKEALSAGDPFRAVIAGVDDTWEISLLYFMLEIIQKSHDINVFDYKRRGLL